MPLLAAAAAAVSLSQWAKTATGAEVGKAVRKAAPNKATGDDQMPTEALKYMEGDILGLLTHLIGIMWIWGAHQRACQKQS